VLRARRDGRGEPRGIGPSARPRIGEETLRFVRLGRPGQAGTDRKDKRERGDSRWRQARQSGADGSGRPGAGAEFARPAPIGVLPRRRRPSWFPAAFATRRRGPGSCHGRLIGGLIVHPRLRAVELTEQARAEDPEMACSRLIRRHVSALVPLAPIQGHDPAGFARAGAPSRVLDVTIEQDGRFWSVRAGPCLLRRSQQPEGNVYRPRQNPPGTRGTNRRNWGLPRSQSTRDVGPRRGSQGRSAALTPR